MLPPPSISAPPLTPVSTATPLANHPTTDQVVSRRRRDLLGTLGPALVGVVLATIWVAPGPPLEARLTLTVFLVAIVLWTATDLDDTLVALGAAGAATLIVGGADDFHASLGSSSVWLLIASFVIAAAVQRSGLATTVVARLLRGATSVSSLCWRLTAALGALAFVIPATSGRAALAMPIYAALVARVDDRPTRRVFALLFPTVILLSASASLLGAGAHLVAVDLVAAASGERIGFLRWAVLAVPATVLSCAAGTAAILYLFLDPEARRRPAAHLLAEATNAARSPEPAGADPAVVAATRRRVTVVLGGVLAAWCTIELHGIDPAVIAVVGAVAVCIPGRGGTRLTDAIDEIPWHLVLFLAATTALGTALLSSGAADWLGGSALRHVGHLPDAVIVTCVVAISLLAHLVIGSRSARASVLVPIVIATALATGVDPTALVFASTIAAGYCLTLPVSAKPIAMFQRPSGPDGEVGYDVGDLLRLSAVLVPVHLVLVVLCSLVVWPALGLAL